MKKIVLFCTVLFLFLASKGYSQYLTQDFEGSWSGSPEAPSGWTQSRVVMIGNGIPDGIATTTGEKDWAKNTNTGVATWSLTPSTPGTVPNSAVSGTGVAWLQTRDFGGSGQNWGSRRLESPTIDLSSSTSPYLRFWMFNADGSSALHMRIMGSSDGGTTWLNIQQFTPNFVLAGTAAASTPWSRITVAIPAAFRTANMKIGIEVGSPWGTNNVSIDDVSVEEFSPTTIVSTGAGGLWSDVATWVGGVVPSSDNNVVISAGATVNLNVNIARVQNLQVDGILQYNSTTATILLQTLGSFTVTATGTYNSFSGTTGKRTYIGGNINNAGTINFAISATSTSEAALIWLGYGPYTFTNSGTISFSKINTIWCAVTQGVTFNSPVVNTFRFVLALGTVNPNGNLTLGNSASNTTMTIERLKGSFTTAPLFGSGVTRSVSYTDGTGVTSVLASQPYSPSKETISPGEEVEVIGTRTITGTMLVATHGRLQLAYPLNVGTASTGALTLTRGIVMTDATNILRTSAFFTPPAGTAPSVVTPPVTHGSYISGPIRVDFPVTTASRNFALGSGTSYNDSVPTSNVLKTVLLSTTTAWSASTSITGSIEAKPTGSVNAPLTTVLGTRSYRMNLNGGSDIPTNASIALIGNNYNYGNGAGSDSLLGNQQNLFVAQSTSGAGTWSSRSLTSGTGAYTNNTNYTRTSSTAAPGPISPIAVNGEYFCLATDASFAANVGPFSLSPSGASFYSNGTTNIPMTGVIKNTGLATTPNPVTVVRTIIGTAYSSTTTVPAGLTANATANTTFDDFTGFTSGVTYQIKDSTYMVGDGSATNDTASVFFTPSIAKKMLVIWNDQPSRDSLIIHLNASAFASQYDVAPTSGALPNAALSNWKTIFALYASGSAMTAITNSRDSLKTWLDGSTGPSDKRSLLLFGNDIGYSMDIRRNASATAADTIFYRQYLHAQYWSDDWVDNFVSADSTLKGTASPFLSITGQRVNDAFPDCVAPATWNTGSGTLNGILVPTTESGDNDSCAAVSYIGPTYNMFYGTNVYKNYVPTVTGFDSPQGALINQVIQFVQDNEGVAPVELASFTSSIDRRNVTLRWSTVTEENNSGFDIERRVSGSSNTWAKVGNVTGSGTTNTTKNYSFSENNLATGRYNYRLKQMDFNGNFKYYDLAGEVIVGVPVKFDISQNYPNPFNPSTKINFDLPFDSKVQIKVFDITGREMTQILNETKTAGYHTVQFNALNLASGVYFYMINANGGNQSYVKTMKMVLVK